MTLSVGDVENKQFTPAMRGYHVDQVDDFLDDVVATLRAHEQRLRDAQDRIRTLEEDLSSRGSDETTISRAFLAAQRSADALIAEAEEAARRIRRDAETEAAVLTGQRDEQRRKLVDEIEVMKGAVSNLRSRLGELAGTIGADVASMEAVLAEAETEVRQPLVAVPPIVPGEPRPESPAAAESTSTEPEDTAADEAPTPLATNQSVASIIDELPTLDLTEEGPPRVSSRPWERG
ncbi:MAG TPA: DivIVA domain-containing protein [Acidimicrobiia bacterium]|nr:DivIVA domain-containing protein [Acidimicrobiia bacterium]